MESAGNARRQDPQRLRESPASRRPGRGRLTMNARLGKYRLACRGLLALLFCFGSAAQAGIDESIVKEIMNIQRELDSLPAQRRAEVQRRMGELEQEAARAPPGSEVHARIRREIVALQKELESLPQVATRHFPGVRNKI